MHYYKRNLGDYAKKCGRLTMLQHGSYTLLIDACYDRETFPTLEQALEWTWASTEAEIEAVKFVLSRFFKLDKDGCYVQDRILEELLQYHKNADINKRIADEREAKRKANNTNRERSVNEAPPNHKPLTTNQEPLTKVEKTHRGSRLPTDFVFPKEWADFCIQQRPDLNLQQTFDSFKDYWVSAPKGTKLDWSATWRNWVRSQAIPKTNKFDVVLTTTPPPANQDAALRKIHEDDKKAVPIPLEVLRRMAELKRKTA
ncbi:Protein of unknown function DUF1376 [uncultured Caudovirales phage]|uniref:DUF1376 domain-containing protein n=1 Tax=uncultured Caudovirales phage TaxID=2100421 RepID=A0A6J5KL61_9CAUD|nr:Protein of unknown function DUF1376 [uncultured Caudovirales phage]